VSRALAFLLVTSAVVAAAPAVAKEGVVARLVTPIPREAEPGSTITVVWTLASVDDGKRRPFGAGGVFVRLFGPHGSRSPRAYASELGRGRYRARVVVPREGVSRVVIGLMGTRCDANGCRPAPVRFPIAGKSLR
jgi:hypothetical protein